jgi:hypothetical protein
MTSPKYLASLRREALLTLHPQREAPSCPFSQVDACGHAEMSGSQAWGGPLTLSSLASALAYDEAVDCEDDQTMTTEHALHYGVGPHAESYSYSGSIDRDHYNLGHNIT